MRDKGSVYALEPIPDAEGIQKTKQLYKDRFNMEITDEQAADILGRVMRWLYLVSELYEEQAAEQKAESRE